MRIVIVSVGRWKRGPERELFERYVARCPWPIELVEVTLKRTTAPGNLRAAEAAAIAPYITSAGPLIVLDEHGGEPTSVDIARTLGDWRDTAAGPVRLVIGGADGIDPALRTRADAVWSLGRVTWPHLLVRVLVAEQLYRAASILAGHPYHREG